jgi:hypothetical protein
MDASASLTVRVERRGNKYVWELHRDGLAQPVKFSAPIYSSEESARSSGNDVMRDHLARLEAKWAQRTKSLESNRRGRRRAQKAPHA